MLADTKLSHKFWVEKPSAAVYLQNCSPVKEVKGMIFFEVWTGWAFGCDAYAHVVGDEWQKLDSKARNAFP